MRVSESGRRRECAVLLEAYQPIFVGQHDAKHARRHSQSGAQSILQHSISHFGNSILQSHCTEQARVSTAGQKEESSCCECEAKLLG